MIVSQPPYALAPTAFRFPALAALAGRAPLGGPREVAMAAYLAARMAHDVLPERGLVQSVRKERAQTGRNWLSTVTLPASIRPSLARLVDASGGDRRQTADAVRAVLAAAADLLDARARGELEQLAATLEQSSPQPIAV